MRRWPLTLAALAALLLTDGALAQIGERRDGSIVERMPCPAFTSPSYESYVGTVKAAHADEVEAAKREGLAMGTPPGIATREQFERNIAASRRVDCTRLVYMSDGLKVAGLLWRPIDQGPKPLPLIIFNRGGNRNFGQVPPWHGNHRLAAEGFVVLAPQYRGVDGGEGVEQFGGADVHDILNLVPVAQSLGDVDLQNVFMLGWSRGAMSTFVAMKQGIKLNAIAVGGGLLDLVAEAGRRPGLVSNVWSQLIPDFATKRDERLRERSVMYWPEQVNVPVLILHGGGDWRASPAEALAFAQKLQAAGKTYELIVYANDDHGISVNSADRNRRIVEWFRKHMR
jgi:dipeptidyl aminopeptidase/acylaminoacyl peptidase